MDWAGWALFGLLATTAFSAVNPQYSCDMLLFADRAERNLQTRAPGCADLRYAPSGGGVRRPAEELGVLRGVGRAVLEPSIDITRSRPQP